MFFAIQAEANHTLSLIFSCTIQSPSSDRNLRYSAKPVPSIMTSRVAISNIATTTTLTPSLRDVSAVAEAATQPLLADATIRSPARSTRRTRIVVAGGAGLDRVRRLASSEVAVAGTRDVSIGGLAGQAGGARLGAGAGAALAFGERALSLESRHISHLVDIECNRDNHEDTKQGPVLLGNHSRSNFHYALFGGPVYSSHRCYAENRRDNRQRTHNRRTRKSDQRTLLLVA